MLIIEAVREWIEACPLRDKTEPVLVDFLGEEAISYSIQPLPGTRIVKQYTDGGSMRAFSFAFEMQEVTETDISRISNSGFCEQFADYMENATKTGDLPELGDGKRAVSISSGSWGAMIAQDAKTGTYQTICTLKYYQERMNK